MSTDLFGSESFSAKIGGSCCCMSTRAISFSVLISSLVIITLIFPRPSDIFGFFLVFFFGTVKYFCFTVLPFDLSSAPYIFTEFLRPLVKFRGFNGV